MARIDGIDLEKADRYSREVLEAQEKTWGAPLLNLLPNARRHTIFRGVRAMWTGIDASGLVDAGLRSLINRRVAALNRCEF